MRRPVIYISDILAWADAFRKRVGRWPGRDDRDVPGHPELTWCAIDQALQKGHRGLLRGSSLAKLLHNYRHVRHRNLLPPFTLDQILGWADAHHARTGEWPLDVTGPISDAPGETWRAVNRALQKGRRGLPGGSTLARLLEEHRGVRNHLHAPRLKPKQVLAWADAYHKRTRSWPTRLSGPIAEAPGETWHAVDAAFVAGSRGLVGYGSLARFLARQRGVRNRKALPALSVKQILVWAEAYHERTGRWPVHTSGPIPEAPGETWGGVHSALYRGWRGFKGGSSLYRVLRDRKEAVRRRRT
jgi:hypothetical protein